MPAPSIIGAVAPHKLTPRFAQLLPNFLQLNSSLYCTVAFMFQSQQYLEKHTGKWGTSRFSYLQMLVTEFQDTAQGEYKHQVLANLANFSYDPLNYEWLRQLNVVDLFLDMITETDEKIVEFAIAGICNLCCDKLNQDIIYKNGGIPSIKKCLSSDNEETVLSAMTTLYYLVNHQTKAEILTGAVMRAIEAYSHAPSIRLKNLAKCFLETHSYAHREQASRARQQQQQQQQQQDLQQQQAAFYQQQYYQQQQYQQYYQAYQPPADPLLPTPEVYPPQ